MLPYCLIVVQQTMTLLLFNGKPKKRGSLLLDVFLNASNQLIQWFLCKLENIFTNCTKSESLAGRISYKYLSPILISEVPENVSVETYLFRGGEGRRIN